MTNGEIDESRNRSAESSSGGDLCFIKDEGNMRRGRIHAVLSFKVRRSRSARTNMRPTDSFRARKVRSFENFLRRCLIATVSEISAGAHEF